MRYPGLDAFLKDGKAALAKGPVAMIFVEDLVEVESTIRHHLNLEFAALILFAPEELALPRDLAQAPNIHRVHYPMQKRHALTDAVNAVIAAAPGIWMYYCFNAEYLFYPFCETRSVAEMLAFHTEERRDAVLTYVIDLYAADLDTHPDAVCVEDAYLDKSGYYALARPDENGHPKERQLDFFGGLRWRFEEHVPPASRKIDRIALFRAAKGLQLRPNHTFSDEEYNTYSCPWHHNITAAICSFRTAKALKSNAGSSFEVHNFRWHNSTPFTWHSKQLLDLGLMEPGQWF
ncbi:hypothetical protein P1J78_18905 [Psychromarinibacter sp. C21-152]|uniref:Glycosyl transferase family 2 n=1 Tax=Psychromarinibacter sediminicola TaxID=3033385 RepID=A0AAE3TBM8_9RHOB|nr:hypothetical protein [Psychromarinibacter sediminicola]MDF0602815.1 hypothetical protein [Psychromarinibacter sediminicola]